MSSRNAIPFILAAAFGVANGIMVFKPAFEQQAAEKEMKLASSTSSAGESAGQHEDETHKGAS